MKDTWDSTVELPKRFDIIPDLDATERKFFEEVQEFSKALVLAERDIQLEGHTTTYKESETCKEGADVIVMVMQNLNALGITWEEFKPFIEYTNDKNDSKTLYTHYVNERGIIVKKSDGNNK